MNIYLFHTNGEDDKTLSAKTIFLFWVTLNLIGFSLLWPRSELQRLSYVQLGLLSSLAIFKSGIEWQKDRFISQRIWLLMPIIVFHLYTVIIRFQLIQLSFSRTLIIVVSTIVLIYLLNFCYKNLNTLRKNYKDILRFTIPMMLNLLLTGGVELEMKDTLQSLLKETEWSVFSLGIFVYAFHGLLGNNLSPILNSWIKSNVATYRQLLRILLKLVLGVSLILFLGHTVQLYFISMFNICYLVYSISILLWLVTNVLSVQFLNSKIIILFGIVQAIIYVLVRAEFSIGHYILTHFAASLIAFVFAIFSLWKMNSIVMNENETE
jgi:hypothetical protein